MSLRNKLTSILAGAALAYASTSNAQNIDAHSLSNNVNAIIQVESGNNPKAKRYEPHLGESSYGLGQILESTARELEKKHSELPRLGKTKKELEQNLFSPDINRQYTTQLFLDYMAKFKEPELAVAAYNAGPGAVKNALCQQHLNYLYQTNIVPDGVIGAVSAGLVKRFQKDNGLAVDGKIGPKTYAKIQEVWSDRFPDLQNSAGAIPTNNITPRHMQKFRNALKNQN